MIRRRSPLLAAAIPALLLSACTTGGDFPSLAIRDVEREVSIDEPERAAPVVAADPALRAQVRRYVDAAAAGQPEFDAALAEARRLAARAGAPASESWIVAQQALSRAEAARTPAIDALTALDALALERAETPTNSQDFADLLAATEAMRERVGTQQAALDAIRLTLGN